MLEGSSQPGRRHVRLAHLRPDRILVLRKRHRRRAGVMVTSQDVAGAQPAGIGDQVTE